MASAGLGTMTGALAGLSPRERRLLLLLALASLLFVFFLVSWWSSRRLAAIEAERADTLEALRTIQRLRPEIAQRAARREALLARFRTRPPPLTTFVEAKAGEAQVRVAEAQDRPPATVGRRFTERSVQIRLRAVSLTALADFMDRLEQAPFPIAITQVRVRRRFGERNSYDVDDMVIATWEPAPEAPRGNNNNNNNRPAAEGTAR